MMATFAVRARWVLISVIIVPGLMCSTSANPDSSSSEDTSFRHRQKMFSKLLFELHGYETKLHRCTYHANLSQCLTFKTGTQTHFHYPYIAKALHSRCNLRDIDLYECMQTDVFMVQLLAIIKEDISKTVKDVCCSLKYCIEDASIGHIESRASNRIVRKTDEDHHQIKMSLPEVKQEMWQEICLNCSTFHAAGMNETVDDKHKVTRLEVLYNMTCSKETVGNFSCTHLNVIAINVLSISPPSSKLLEDARDILRQCNPAFYEDPARTFSALLTSFSDDELSDLESFFSENVAPEIQPRLGRVIGIIVFVAIVTTCIGVIGWLYCVKPMRQRVKTNGPRVVYDVLNSQDDELEDEDGGTKGNSATTSS